MAGTSPVYDSSGMCNIALFDNTIAIHLLVLKRANLQLTHCWLMADRYANIFFQKDPQTVLVAE